MPRPTLLRLVALLAVVAACQSPAPAATPVPDVAALTDTITAREKAWSAAFLAADAAGVAAQYTEDGASVPPTGEWDRGRTAIAGGIQRQFDSTTFSAREDGPEEVIPLAPDYAIEIGRFSSTGTPKAGGPERVSTGRYMVLWRRDTDGTWRIHRDIGSDAPTKP